MSLLLEIACATHPGKVRSHNEDFVTADADAELAVLADGMGGHNAGEVASRIAVEVVSSGLKAEHALDASLDRRSAEALITKHIALANTKVLEAARANPQYAGMGTTLVVVLWHAGNVSFGHVGDSRLYRLRGGSLEQLTRDHSLVQEQLDAGLISSEQAQHAAHRNVLTRAVGTNPTVEADIRTSPVLEQDIYLLCSDGLTDMLTDEEICETLLAHGTRADRAARRLVDSANANGGYDNVSVVLARVVRATPQTAE